MDRYSILDPGSSSSQPPIPVLADATPAKQALRSPPEIQKEKEEDGSPAESASRELEASLQLLTERAQYVTGASGAAIALLEGGTMVCVASRGASAPALGAHLQPASGLTGESLRTKQLLRCNDVENDARVNRDSCRALGIASLIVMPLLREGEAIGVFELLSDRTHAFEDRDVNALRRLAEMLETALEYSDGAKRAAQTIAAKVENALHAVPPLPSGNRDQKTAVVGAERTPPDSAQIAPTPRKAEETEELKALKDLLALQGSRKSTPLPTVESPIVLQKTTVEKASPRVSVSSAMNLSKCTECGFPVSAGRTLCLDCDELRSVSSQPRSEREPDLFSQIGGSAHRKGWWHEHLYTVGMVLISLATAVGLLLWRH